MIQQVFDTILKLIFETTTNSTCTLIGVSIALEFPNKEFEPLYYYNRQEQEDYKVENYLLTDKLHRAEILATQEELRAAIRLIKKELEESTRSFCSEFIIMNLKNSEDGYYILSGTDVNIRLHRIMTDTVGGNPLLNPELLQAFTYNLKEIKA